MAAGTTMSRPLGSILSAVMIYGVVVVLVTAQPPRRGNDQQCPASDQCGDCIISEFEMELTSSKRIIRSNGIPNHNYHVNVPGDTRNPNQVCAHRKQYTMPRNPTKGSSFTDTPMGEVGILFTGGALYNHLSNPTGSDDVAAKFEADTLDHCYGHAAPGCQYHYHAWDADDQCAFDCVHNECELLGYMFDGFPVYSHCGQGAKLLKSCYIYTSSNDVDNDSGTDTTDYVFTAGSGGCQLDEANGFDFDASGDVYTYLDTATSETKTITGYGYVMTTGYPHVPVKYRGSETAEIVDYCKEIARNEYDACTHHKPENGNGNYAMGQGDSAAGTCPVGGVAAAAGCSEEDGAEKQSSLLAVVIMGSLTLLFAM